MELLSPQRWNQLKPLLDQLFDLPPDQHLAFIERHAHDDPTLHRLLLASLEANRSDSSFLQGLDDQHINVLLDHLPFGDVTNTGASFADTSFTERNIGPYRLVRPIARGGMGHIFLAERADGAFEQQVALKLIKPGLGSRGVHRRFLAERQILARLRHDNIARLLDGGMNEDGQPYFVMEYIDGIPITKYCDKHRLSVEGRLELFAEVCEAVQYAHRNLVVHRDLKPSNILVTPEGKVKLLDFGIAKVLVEEETDEETALTRTGVRLMTPVYAAPEQVMGETVTTATDVYTLGVLLYELLTGQRPYTLEGQSQAALERVICGIEPGRPSTAVGQTITQPREEETTETLTLKSTTERWGLSEEKLRQRLRGDLDTIVLKALAKEPERRYASAEAFVEDVYRHLAGLPVSAQPDTMGYRLRKFVRRHRMPVAVATVFAVLLLVVVILSVRFAVVTRQQSLQIAREASKADQVKEFLVGLFKASDPYEKGEAEGLTARELLDRGQERIELLDEEPEVQAEMMHVLGVVYRELGMYGEAQPLLNQSLELRRRLFGKEHVDVAYSLRELAWLLYLLGQYDEAERLNREALSIRRKLLGNEHLDVTGSLNDLALVLMEKGNYLEAEQLHREVLKMHQVLLDENHPDIATNLNDLAIVLSKTGRYDEAEQLHRKVLKIQQKLYGREHPDVARGLNNLAVVLEKKGDYDEAERLQRKALKMRKRFLGDEHHLVAIDMDNLSHVLREMGKYDEAEQLNREALAIFRRLFGDEHPDVGISLSHLGLILYEKGEYEEAERLLRETLSMYRNMYGTEHSYTADRLRRLSRLLIDTDRAEEADSLLRLAHTIYNKSLGETHNKTTETKMLLGKCRTAQARYDEAEPLLLESMEIFQEQQKKALLQQTREALVDLYTAWGKQEQAVIYQDALMYAESQ